MADDESSLATAGAGDEVALVAQEPASAEAVFQAAQATGCAGVVQIDTFGIVRGKQPFTGWAVDNNEIGVTAGVDLIDVIRGDVRLASGAIGVARPDVDAYLRRADLRAGFAIEIDWAREPRGMQTYTVRARTSCGWAEAQVTLDVDPAPPVGLSISDQRRSVDTSGYSGGGYSGGGYYGGGYYGGSSYGGGAETNFDFTVTLSGASTQTVTVYYATADGSAVSGTDYAPTNGTLTFGAGETSKTVTVRVYGGGSGDTNFYVRLSNPVNASIADGEGIGTIERRYDSGYYGSGYYRSGYYGGGYSGGYSGGGYYGGGYYGGGIGLGVGIGLGAGYLCPTGTFWNGVACTTSGAVYTGQCPAGTFFNGVTCATTAGVSTGPGVGSITIGDAVCMAGTPCFFRVTHTGGTASVTVGYSTDNLSAIGALGCGGPTSAPDYVAVPNGSVTVAPNSFSTIAIMTCPRAPQIAMEFFVVRLTGVTAGTAAIIIPQGTGRIDFIPPPPPEENGG